MCLGTSRQAPCVPNLDTWWQWVHALEIFNYGEKSVWGSVLVAENTNVLSMKQELREPVRKSAPIKQKWSQ
jgi:hypothetical protein